MQRLAAPLDGDADFARVQQVVIVFGLTDANCGVNRDSESPQCLAKSCGFGDCLGEDHEPVAVEGENERQLQPP